MEENKMNENLNNNYNNMPNYNYEKNNNKKGNNLLIFVLILIIFVLLALLIYVGFFKDGKKDNNSNKNNIAEKHDENKTDDYIETLSLDGMINPLEIVKLLNLLEGRNSIFSNNNTYKELDSSEPIMNNTFTMEVLRNKKKLFSSDISEYLKLISLTQTQDLELERNNHIALTDNDISKIACGGKNKLYVCSEYANNGVENLSDYTLRRYGNFIDENHYKLDEINNLYKIGIIGNKGFYFGYDNTTYGICDIVEKEIVCLNVIGGGSYYNTDIDYKIIKIKRNDKNAYIYIKPVKFYYDDDAYIYRISNLMSDDFIDISTKIETQSIVKEPEPSQIANLFDKYSDKLETLVFGFEKNSNGKYVFDYVELVN